MSDLLTQYRRDGYAIVRGLFTPAEMAEMAGAFDRMWAEGMRHPHSYRHGNLFFRQGEDAKLGRVLRLVQWPSYVEPTLARLRTDPRILRVLEPLLGRDLKQIINQLHWKPAGAAQTEFGYHQDVRFRQPRTAYHDLDLYLQTGIAVDPHRVNTGCMTVVPGSHRLGELEFPERGEILDRDLTGDDLKEAGIDPGNVVDLVLEPGDFAFWSLYLVHGSRPNRSPADRRLYINGYVTATACDRGEWAFRDGRPCPLGAPQLVHYEDLHSRGEPHYVDAG